MEIPCNGLLSFISTGNVFTMIELKNAFFDRLIALYKNVGQTASSKTRHAQVRCLGPVPWYKTVTGFIIPSFQLRSCQGRPRKTLFLNKCDIRTNFPFNNFQQFKVPRYEHFVLVKNRTPASWYVITVLDLPICSLVVFL